MKQRIEVRSKVEFDACIRAGNIAVVIECHVVLRDNSSAVLWDNSSAELWGNSSAELWGNSSAELWGNSSAELRGNSSAVLMDNSSAVLRGNSSAVLWDNSSAVLWGNSSAELWDNSSAELRDNSSAVLRGNSSAVLMDNSSAVLRGNSSAVLMDNSSAELRDNSSAEATGNVFIRLFSAFKIKASLTVVIMMHGVAKFIEGGRRIDVIKPQTVSEWCAHYGVEVKDNVAILFKGVDDDYSTSQARSKGILYQPGNTPIAPDWDGGIVECGGGLHFSPAAVMTLEFNENAKHFIACPVRISDIAIHPDGKYPQKVKAVGCCAPVWEVDRRGKKIEQKEQKETVKP